MHALAYILVYLHLTVFAPYVRDAIAVGKDVGAVVRSPVGQKAIARVKADWKGRRTR
jgi:hypothetical protein